MGNRTTDRLKDLAKDIIDLNYEIPPFTTVQTIEVMNPNYGIRIDDIIAAQPMTGPLQGLSEDDHIQYRYRYSQSIALGLDANAQASHDRAMQETFSYNPIERHNEVMARSEAHMREIGNHTARIMEEVIRSILAEIKEIP